MVLPFMPKWTYPSVHAEPYTLLPPAEHVCRACCASPPDHGATERIRIDGHWQPTSPGAAPSPRYRRPDRPPRVEGSGVRQRRGARGPGGDIAQHAESSGGLPARPPTTPAGRGCRRSRRQSRSETESASMTSRPGSGRPTRSPAEVRDILEGVARDRPDAFEIRLCPPLEHMRIRRTSTSNGVRSLRTSRTASRTPSVRPSSSTRAWSHVPHCGCGTSTT